MQTTSTWAAMGCLLMAMASGTASAESTAFRLVNNTQFVVSQVYLWPAGSSERGPDRLGLGVLGSGDSMDFPDEESGMCRYNVLVVPEDSSQRKQWSNLNLCQLSSFTLHFNYMQRALWSSTDQNSCDRYASGY